MNIDDKLTQDCQCHRKGDVPSVDWTHIVPLAASFAITAAQTIFRGTLERCLQGPTVVTFSGWPVTGLYNILSHVCTVQYLLYSALDPIFGIFSPIP